jgi:AAHS family 4-hydroxybenzoate transporter-like MFS transporter
MSQKIDLEALIDTRPLSSPQFRVVGLCGLVAMIDGFDTQSIALVAPEVATAWGVPAAEFGLIFGAGLFGGLLGALGFGAIADRLGRKPAVLLAVLVFGVATLLTPYVTNMRELMAVRIVTGIGLGGALPSIISITSEYSPQRLRATLVSIMFCGFPIGAVVGGLISARLIPVYGWTSVFYLGGAIPLLLLPFFTAYVPESVRYLAQRNSARLAQTLDRLGWADRWNGEIGPKREEKRASVKGLFAPGLASATLLLWATLFLSLLLTYFLINWIPMLAKQSGIGIQQAVLAVTALNLGGFLGCLAVGRMADRYGRTMIISTAFLLGAVAVASLGMAGKSGGLLIGVAFLSGFFSIGAQMCTVALSSTYYSTALRATGVGWSMAAGRTGAISGPVIGGALIATGLNAPILFLIGGLVSVAAGGTVFILGRTGR